MAVIQKYGKKHSPDLGCHAESRPSDKAGAPGCPKWPERNGYWSRPEARVWTVVLLLGTCLLYCARVAMPICAVSMAEQFSWTKRESGMVLGSFFWGYCFTQVFGGYVSDRVGGEKVLLLSAAAWGSMTAFTPVLAHFCSRPIVMESERGFLMSTVSSGSYLGTLVIGGAGSLMLDLYGWQSVFYASGLLSVLWAYCMWNGGAQSMLSKRHWLRLLKQPAVCAVIVTHLCAASTFFTLLSWLPTFFKETFPDAKGWVFNVVPWLVAIPSSLLSGCLSDHLISRGYDTASVRKLMQFFSMGVSSVFTLLLCGSTTFPWAVAFVSATMGFITFSHSGVSVNVQDLAPSCAGSLFGVMNTCGAFSGVLLVYFSGYLIETTGSWTSVFALITAVNLLGLATFLAFADARRVDIDPSKGRRHSVHI
ncbi:Solute carrier family 17 member 9 [Liparis tanakae]|uniref:Solute carrier family 17 member 9 n=1 Tax=Liparis tanakae TaxID=230148 RepID=A0A4Z2FK89_9TELE|nr:Solute carrier family 17 member 9 [Liparis tanakae]